MRRAELALTFLIVAAPALAFAATDAPLAHGARLLVGGTGEAAVVSPAPAPATRRLLIEGGVVGGLGVVAPFLAYGGFTALQSFVGFFAGFLSATVIGAVLAPIGVVIAGRLAGLEGGGVRALVGTLLGLLAGVLVGLPLATLPGAAYLVGLGVLWALPSLGALIALEWGQPATPQTGAVVLRF